VIARLAARATHDVEAKAVVVFTRSGKTARALSDERPKAPILALTTSEEAQRQLGLYWGVSAVKAEEMRSVADLLRAGERAVLDGKLALLGSNSSPAAANALEIARIGDAT
jgi:pyruvate kinase